MSAMMSAPPPSSMPPPNGPPPPVGKGHGPFTEEDIQQMMADSGYSYEQVCAAIDQTGATSKEQVFPNIYSGAGIQPQVPADEQMTSEGVVQGRPLAQPGAQPVMAPPESGEGEAPPSAPAVMADGEGMGIDPRVAQALHSQMAPSKYKRRGR